MVGAKPTIKQGKLKDMGRPKAHKYLTDVTRSILKAVTDANPVVMSAFGTAFPRQGE